MTLIAPGAAAFTAAAIGDCRLRPAAVARASTVSLGEAAASRARCTGSTVQPPTRSGRESRVNARVLQGNRIARRVAEAPELEATGPDANGKSAQGIAS